MLLLFILFYYSFKTLWNYTIQNRCDLGPVFRTAAFALCDELIHGLQQGSWHVEDTFALWLFLVACFPASQSFLEYNYTNYTPKTYPNSQLPRFLPYIPRLVHDFHWRHARCALFPLDFPAPGSALPLRKQIHEKLRPTAYLPVLFHSKPRNKWVTWITQTSWIMNISLSNVQYHVWEKLTTRPTHLNNQASGSAWQKHHDLCWHLVIFSGAPISVLLFRCFYRDANAGKHSAWDSWDGSPFSALAAANWQMQLLQQLVSTL